MAETLVGKKIAILATDGFEQAELLKPRAALDEAGATTQIVSPAGRKAKGWNHTEWGEEVDVDVALDDADPADFEALQLPGGVMNPDHLRMDPKAVEFVKHFFEAGKPVAAICHAPWMLIEAGVARGRRIASWPSLKTDLKNAGAEWVDEEAVRDGNLVTSRNPNDIPAFNREMIKLFAEGSGQPTRAKNCVNPVAEFHQNFTFSGEPAINLCNRTPGGSVCLLGFARCQFRFFRLLSALRFCALDSLPAIAITPPIRSRPQTAMD